MTMRGEVRTFGRLIGPQVQNYSTLEVGPQLLVGGPSGMLDFGIENPVVLTSAFPRYRHFKLTRIFVTVRVQCRGIAYSSSWIMHNYQELSFKLKLLC